MKKFLNKKILIILSIITLIILIFSLFYKSKLPSPQLLSSSPTSNSQRVSLTGSIQLKFDQNIDLARLTVTSNPPEDWSIQSGDDNSLIILRSKQYLRVETEYFLSILYDKQLISTLNFRTTPQQGDPRYTQQVLQEMARDYPLSVKLPYSTSQYRVVYSAPLTLEITIKNPNLTSAQAISEIKSWVTSVGGDAGAHKYVIGTNPLPSDISSSAAVPAKTASPSPTPFNWDAVPNGPE